MILPAHPQKPQRGDVCHTPITHSLVHVAELDGLRALAAIGVMAFHGWQGGAFVGLPLAETWSRVMVFGQTGVDLFFVLSGFLITRILIVTKDRPRYLRNFYGRRALRIFPLYYAFLFLYCYGIPWVQRAAAIPFELSWWYWIYLQNIASTFPGLEVAGPGHYWSLGVEEHFYLIWPLIVWISRPRFLPWLCIAVAILTIGVRSLLLFNFDLPVFYFSPARLDGLAMGALLACLDVSSGLKRWRTCFVLAVVISLPALVAVWTITSGAGNLFIQLFKFSFISAFYTALLGLILVSSGQPCPQALLGNSVLRYIGKISYGLYVYHGVCFGLTAWVGKAFGLPIFGLIAGVGLALFVSHISFHYFESFFLRFKSCFK